MQNNRLARGLTFDARHIIFTAAINLIFSATAASKDLKDISILDSPGQYNNG